MPKRRQSSGASSLSKKLRRAIHEIERNSERYDDICKLLADPSLSQINQLFITINEPESFFIFKNAKLEELLLSKIRNTADLLLCLNFVQENIQSFMLRVSDELLHKSLFELKHQVNQKDFDAIVVCRLTRLIDSEHESIKGQLVRLVQVLPENTRKLFLMKMPAADLRKHIDRPGVMAELLGLLPDGHKEAFLEYYNFDQTRPAEHPVAELVLSAKEGMTPFFDRRKRRLSQDGELVKEFVPEPSVQGLVFDNGDSIALAFSQVSADQQADFLRKLVRNNSAHFLSDKVLTAFQVNEILKSIHYMNTKEHFLEALAKSSSVHSQPTIPRLYAAHGHEKALEECPNILLLAKYLPRSQRLDTLIHQEEQNIVKVSEPSTTMVRRPVLSKYSDASLGVRHHLLAKPGKRERSDSQVSEPAKLRP